jgi:hypothetical protein
MTIPGMGRISEGWVLPRLKVLVTHSRFCFHAKAEAPMLQRE